MKMLYSLLKMEVQNQTIRKHTHSCLVIFSALLHVLADLFVRGWAING